MQPSTTQKTVVGFAAALGILVVMGTIAYQTADSVVETSHMVTRTQGILLLTDALRARIGDAQSALEELVASRDPEARDRYADAVVSIGESFRLLDTLTLDRASFAQRITPLRAEVTRRLADFDNLVQGRSDEGLDELQEASGSLFVRAASELRLIEREELAFLSSHSTTEDVAARRTQRSIVLGSLGAVGFFVVATLAIVGDLRARHRAEVQLRSSERRFRTLADSAPVGIFLADKKGRCELVNVQYTTITGLSAERATGDGWIDGLYPEDREKVRSRWLNTSNRNARGAFEYRFVRPDRSLVWVAGRSSPMFDDSDNIIGFIGTITDITDRKLAQMQSERLGAEIRRKNIELERKNLQVERATRLKSEFLANMSHELRTPLNGIIGFAELIRDGRAGDVSELQAEFLDDMLGNSRHLLKLINDVLDLSKVEAGRFEFRPEEVDLHEMVHGVRNSVRALAVKKRVGFTVSIDPTIGRVILDPAKLKQVLYNYISNALKFTEDGRVDIRCIAEPQSKFRLDVEDTGIGIREKDIGRLFVEFQQLDQGATKKYQGTGLGLALTKRIVEAQGGSVGVISKWGEGSVFYAILPTRFESESRSTHGESEMTLRSVEA